MFDASKIGVHKVADCLPQLLALSLTGSYLDFLASPFTALKRPSLSNGFTQNRKRKRC